MPPSLVFGFVISSVYGLAFYLLFGSGWMGLLTYWITAVIGFAAGQWLANAMGVSLLSIGSVNVLEATLVSWVSLLGVRIWRNRAAHANPGRRRRA